MNMKHFTIVFLALVAGFYSLSAQQNDFSASEKMVMQHIEKNKMQYENRWLVDT